MPQDRLPWFCAAKIRARTGVVICAALTLLAVAACSADRVEQSAGVPSLSAAESAASVVAAEPATESSASPEIAAGPGTLQVESPTDTTLATTDTTESTQPTPTQSTTSQTTTSQTTGSQTTATQTSATETTAVTTTQTTVATTTPSSATTAPSTTIGQPGTHPDIVRVIAVAGRNPGGDGWKDSYSVGTKCYCATTFDHDIGDVDVATPAGTKKVREVCEKIGKGPGPQGRPIYNDIQCGNGPANNAGDEDDCPGRVDIGREGCGHIGPIWDLTVFQ